MPVAETLPRLVDPGTPPVTCDEVLCEGFIEALLEATTFYGIDAGAGLFAALEAANRLAL